MAVSILIAAPSHAFGELIRETLLEVDDYQPVLATSLDEALHRAHQNQFDLLILDLDMAGIALPQLWHALQQARPGLSLVVISSQGKIEGLTLNGISPHGFLTKPFYAPDLIRTVREIVSAKESAPDFGASAINQVAILDQVAGGVDPATANVISGDTAVDDLPKPGKSATVPWLEDVTRAAQHLTRLSLEADAQAALITRSSQMWAYAGQLSQPAAEELAQALIRDWGDRLHSGSSDLACFVHLKTTGEEYMLYATELGGDMALALAFDAKTPFSRIRAQASHLARSLASPPAQAMDTTEISVNLPPADAQDDDFDEDEKEEEWIAEFPAEPLFPLDSVPPPTPDRGEMAQTHPEENHDADAETSIPDVASLPEEVAPSEAAVQQEPFKATQSPTEQSVSLQGLDSSSQGIFGLHYACILIPRLPRHHLTGDLTLRLGEWMRQLNLAYGWRLEHLSVRPDYLLWVSRVSPDTSPANLIKKIRKQTSQRIFEEFPLLARDNPSGDFWAPSHLILTTSQPPAAQLLKDFIEQTRREQGIPLEK